MFLEVGVGKGGGVLCYEWYLLKWLWFNKKLTIFFWKQSLLISTVRQQRQAFLF